MNTSNLTFSTKHWDKWSPRTIKTVRKHFTLQAHERTSTGRSMMQMRLDDPQRYDFDLTLVRRDRKIVGVAVVVSDGLRSIQLYIKEEYRRQGIGKQLLRYLVERDVKNGCKQFQVFPWNPASAHFYRGFYNKFVPEVKASIERKNAA